MARGRLRGRPLRRHRPRRRPLTTWTGPDGRPRCGWSASAPELLDYHDAEWGFPVADDQALFEKLSLELFQSGLSWRTILVKRDNFRAAFRGFDIDSVAGFTDRDVERLLTDAGIVRHRGKIEAVVNNAARAQEVAAREGSLAAYLWRHEPTTVEQWQTTAIALSKDLKRLGWKFVGPTTVFAFMQAVGLVNDHEAGCVIRDEVARAGRSFRRPAS